MTKKQSEQLVPGRRVQDNTYGQGTGTVQGVSAGPAGYWSVTFDNGTRVRIGYRMLDLI